MRLKIFVVLPNIPKPDANSGDRRFFAILEMMAAQHDVDLCVINRESRGASAELKIALKRYRKAVQDLNVRLVPFGWRHIEAALLKTDYDVVFFEFYWVAERYKKLVERTQPDIKSIVDSVDVHFAREQTAADLGILQIAQVEQTKKAELEVYNTADAVIVVSDLDQELLIAEHVKSNLYLIPNIVPVTPQFLAPDAKHILFVGGFAHEPNIDGIIWFVESIWPTIVASVPDSQLTIIGSQPRPEILALNEVQSVEVLGHVSDADLTARLKQTAVSVAPLRYGAGMKGKVVEALASGLAVVTTSIGGQGLGATSGEHLMIADQPAEFAQCVVELLQNAPKRQRLGEAGQSLISELCSPAAAGRVLARMLNETVDSPRSKVTHHSRIKKRFDISAGRFYLLRLVGSPLERFYFAVRPTLRFVYRRFRNARGHSNQ